MTTNTKNESVPKGVSPTVVSGSGSTGPRKLQFNQTNRRKLLIPLIVLVVIIAGWWLFNNYSGGAVFQINGKRYSKAEVKQLAAFQVDIQHVPYKTAAKKVYDALRYQVVAQSLHITVTPGAQKASSANVDAATYKKYKAWIDILAYDTAVKAKLPPATSDGVKGYLYVFWFGDAVQPSYDTPAPKYGNQQAYAADQKYASERSNYYHDQLQNKKMTPNQVLPLVNNDPKLAPRGFAPSHDSKAFGANAYEIWQDQLGNNTNILAYIKSASSNSLSPVMTGTTTTQLGADPGQNVAAYYYFVLVQKKHITNVTQQLNDKLSNLNAKYYGV